MSAVTVTSVSKAYGAQEVLRSVDLHVPNGSITAVLGASGCGKTTLLRIVAGFVRADSGTVSIGERVVDDGTTSTKPELRGVGYVPQEGALFPHLDVAANILFGLPRRERTAARLGELMELAELAPELSTRAPHQLSGGQQQRVAIARALAPRPRVVLLDEPFSGLDAGLRASAGRAVSRVLRHAGATALLVTHDQGEALSLADQVAVMRAGRFVQVAAPADLYLSPVDVETAEFVGGASVVVGQVRAGVATTVLGAIEVGAADGPVRLVLRPEQLVLGAPGTGVPATVEDVSYYGAQVVVRVRLEDGSVVTARGSSTRTPGPGDRVGVTVDGRAITFAEDGQ
ncbi:iron(III) transport system ATP-binding protein [Marmoricola sp. OAE513]|uniref:ABC transporter ATP-binding protein n=1 Tax=Marmoricola sp. OAE513 TaxID=2817894 RepID=UPI001AE6A21C